MAIFDHFEVTVEVQGQPLQEHDANSESDESSDQILESQSICKYIESVSGADFGVRAKILPGYEWDHDCDHVYFNIKINGKRVSTLVIPKLTYSKINGFSIYSSGLSRQQADGSWVEHGYKFSDVKVDDQKTAQGMRDRELKIAYGELGSIAISVQKAGNLRVIGSRNTHRDTYGQIESVPEKAIKGKAITHSISLKDPVPARKRNTCIGDYRGPPVARLKFKYRSIDSLKQLMVIPRSPTPVPLEDRAFDELTDEERRIVFERQRVSIREMKVKIDTKPKFKRERSESVEADARAYKMSRTACGEDCIELD